MEKILLLVTAFLLLNVCLTDAAEFIQTYDIVSPVRLKTTDLFGIIADVQNYLVTVGGTQIIEKSRGNIEFKSEKYDAQFDVPLTKEDIKKVPDDCLSFSLYIRPQNSNISAVRLVLSDNSRYIKVSGNNHDHVVGLLNVIKEKFNPYLTGFGGPKHRFILMAIFYVFVITVYAYVAWRFTDNMKVWAISLIAMIVVPNVVMFAFRWETIFPGTLITHDNLSFFQKYSHIFTFLGFLIALISIIINFLKSITANKALKRDAAKDRRAP